MAVRSEVIRANRALGPLGRYMTVGALGAVLDVGLFIVLHLVLGMPEIGANTLSYVAGTVHNFVLHRFWTFAGRPRKAAAAQFVQYVVVGVSALLVNNLLMLLLAAPFAVLLHGDAAGDLAAKGAATVVSMCLNFAVNHLWTFAVPPRTHAYRRPTNLVE